MEKSKYKGNFDTLNMNVQFIELAARRYADEFGLYGITPEFLDEFLTYIIAVSRLLSDEDALE